MGALCGGEQARVPLVCEHGEERFLMYQLRAKTVDQADGAGTISIEERGLFLHDRQILVDEQPLIDNVDLEVGAAQTPARELQLFGRTDARRIALALEVFAEQFKLFLRRQPFEIDDGNVRR